MPQGTDETATIEFIPLEKWLSDEAVDALLAQHGLSAVDPYALMALNAADSDFASSHPCFTHWRDTSGKWCYVAFDDWLDERRVDVCRHDDGWRDFWRVAGVRI